MNQSKYRFLLWELIAAMDRGVMVDIDDVKRHAEAETISAFLIDRITGADFSIFDSSDWNAVNERFSSMDNAIDASRKFGVERNGMCLLMAWALQGLQDLRT